MKKATEWLLYADIHGNLEKMKKFVDFLSKKKEIYQRSPDVILLGDIVGIEEDAALRHLYYQCKDDKIDKGKFQEEIRVSLEKYQDTIVLPELDFTQSFSQFLRNLLSKNPRIKLYLQSQLIKKLSKFLHEIRSLSNQLFYIFGNAEMVCPYFPDNPDELVNNLSSLCDELSITAVTDCHTIEDTSITLIGFDAINKISNCPKRIETLISHYPASTTNSHPNDQKAARLLTEIIESRGVHTFVHAHTHPAKSQTILQKDNFVICLAAGDPLIVFA